MMKYLLTVILACLLFVAVPVSAHILETDGTIGAVLHVDPNDDPLVGEVSNLYFDFKDTSKKLTLEHCKCIAQVVKNDQQIYSAPLQALSDSKLHATFAYQFPERNVYQIKITGEPLQTGAFQAFVLTYDIRADRQKTVTTNENSGGGIIAYFRNHIAHALGTLFLICSTVGLIIRERLQQRKLS